MKYRVLLIWAWSWGFLAHAGFAQERSINALTMLRSSLAAQSGQTAIQDVTLSGTVEYIAGSNDESVPMIFKGTLAGSTRTDISLSAGTLTEVRQLSVSGASGNWTSGGSVLRALAGHNLMTDPSWCFPYFVVERLITNSSEIVVFLGIENGLAHFQGYQPPPPGLSATAGALIQSLSQIDLYLDSSTLLPVKLSFNTHPDNDALVNIPVSIEFSSYETTRGVSVPMRVQKYLNGTLALDFTVGTTSFNSGLTNSEF